MKKITNFNKNMDVNGENKRVTIVKNASDQLFHLAEESNIPIFITYYSPQQGYQYTSVLPEEKDKEDVYLEMQKFNKFVKVCMDLNEEGNSHIDCDD